MRNTWFLYWWRCTKFI